MNKLFGLSFLLLLQVSFGLCQGLKPKGEFLGDSIKLGEPIKYSLRLHHRSESQILFPDSGFNFAPFELIEKEFFPTKTSHGNSFDSAVYILRTFQLDSTQHLALPIFITDNGDSSKVYCDPDSIYLVQYLEESPINASFKEETEYKSINKDFNYPYLLFYLIILLLIASVIYFFFGKTIRRRYRLISIRIDHNGFLRNFQKLHNEFSITKEPFTIERALSMWKAYLARLENKPINTYTTTEIINLYNQEELKQGLNIIDRAIYGGLVSDEAEKAMISLRRFSVRQYHKRKREIKNV
jgi:hypothetical protein